MEAAVPVRRGGRSMRGVVEIVIRKDALVEGRAR